METGVKGHPMELSMWLMRVSCISMNSLQWIWIAVRANASIKDIAGELLVLEVLCRSEANRSVIFSTKIGDLVSVWLKAQLQCFPEDEEMLSFGDSSSAHRDEEWMRTTSVILTLVDHFNATFLPITPQRGAEGMCRSELCDKYHIFCGVELARLLVKCKEKKEEEWRAMECWLRREVSFCVRQETTERQELITEILTSSGEESWLKLIQGVSNDSLEEYLSDDLIVYLLRQKDIQWDITTL